MAHDRFWVLTQDDLRGIHIYHEDLSSSPCLEKKSLSYSRFYGCNLSNSNMEMADFSYAHFEKCNMDAIVFAASGGFSTRMIACRLTNACFWESGFRDCDFSDSDLTGSYFEGALLEDVKANYKTKFDVQLRVRWKTRSMPPDQKPDILRAIRIAYERAELWQHMDTFLCEEKRTQRKHLLWPFLLDNPSFSSFASWFTSYISDWSSGYSTKPFRVMIIGAILALCFSALYWRLGSPTHHDTDTSAILESIYFSFTTFATLGYGDVTYTVTRPYMRILSTIEAWIGAVAISLFVVVLARKVFR